MAFKPVERNTVSMNKAPVGAFWIGTYTSKKIVQTQQGKDQSIYSFVGEDEKPFSVWGFTSLDMQMVSVAEGSLCRITYKGKSAKKNKYGNYSNLCLVEVDNAEPEEVGEEARVEE